MGLSTTSLNALKGHGLATLGKVAHAISTPGAAPAPEALEEWVRDNLRGANLGDHAALRRLIWEGGALATAELRDQLTNPDGAAHRKVPDAERSRRMDTLRASLSGFLIQGPLEPSHSLLDRAAALERDNQLRYLSPESCTSRIWEITRGKPEKKYLDFESNKLLVKGHAEVPDSYPHSALQLQEALLRRGLAFAFAQIATFPAYQRYVSALFMHFSREPPPGYSRCTVAQLARADRLLFERLVEKDLKPRRTASGGLPLDTALVNGVELYEITVALLPLPLSELPRKPGKREREQRKVFPGQVRSQRLPRARQREAKKESPKAEASLMPTICVITVTNRAITRLSAERKPMIWPTRLRRRRLSRASDKPGRLSLGLSLQWSLSCLRRPLLLQPPVQVIWPSRLRRLPKRVLCKCCNARLQSLKFRN